MESILSIAPFSWGAVFASILSGSIIGLERQLRGKPVGIRTSSLIVLGTYIFITASMAVATSVSDPSRIIGQVVTGVGFLGAGVMMSKGEMVIGVTSAAAIWSLAAIGVCVAVIDSITAVKLSVIVLGILYGVDILEDYSTALTRGAHRKINGWRKKP